MRILTIFVDMIRPNRLATCNEEVSVATPLDQIFEELGGTYYTSCFTPAPDTPRSIATYLTGIDASKNGCDTRIKWPQHFLRDDLKTVFELFLEHNFQVDVFSSPQERENGIFPERILEMDIHNDDLNLTEYLSRLQLEKDHSIFISLPDYHWAFDDFGYSTHGEQLSYLEVKKSLDIIFNNLDKDDFDHVFLFSDHGFKLVAEWKSEPKCYLLNEDRTNILMVHRSKGQETIVRNDKLCSIADFYATYQDILGEQGAHRGISLLSSAEREHVIVEDHMNFAPSVNQNIELWSLITKESIYIRELSKATLIDRVSKTIRIETIEDFDAILEQESSFLAYYDEYLKVFAYERNILAKTNYMNGKKRVEGTKIAKYYFIILDVIKKACGCKV